MRVAERNYRLAEAAVTLNGGMRYSLTFVSPERDMDDFAAALRARVPGVVVLLGGHELYAVPPAPAGPGERALTTQPEG